MSIILNLLVLLIVSLIFAVILRSKREGVSGKQWFSKKTTLSIVGVYILLLFVANVADSFLPASNNAVFEPVEKKELRAFDKQYAYLNAGNPEKVDPSYIIDTWNIKASANQIAIKPRTVGELPVYIIVDRTVVEGDSATATLFKGTMVVDNFIMPSYSNHVEIQTEQNTLLISSKASNHYEVASFKMHPMMHQFTRYGFQDDGFSVGESLPVLYVEIPESLNLIIDESIKSYVNEF